MSQALQTIDHDPMVFDRDGELFTTSRAVAEYFGKSHSNVLRDIRCLSCSEDFRAINFEFTYENKTIGTTTRDEPTVVISADGFTFLAYGYRGEKAGRLRERYIAKFNQMRRALQEMAKAPSSALAINLDDEQHLIELSAALLGKNRELKARAERAEHLVEIARPAVELQKRIEASALSICLQDAGRLLEIGANKGIDLMANAGWLFRKAGRWTAKAVYVERGWLEHKIYEGGSFTSIQPRVTGLGLVALSKLVGKPITQIDAFNMIEGARRQGLLTSN